DFPALFDDVDDRGTASGEAPDLIRDDAGEPAAELTAVPDLSDFDLDTGMPDDNDNALDELSLFSEDQSSSEPAAVDNISSGNAEPLEAEIPDLSMFDDDDVLSSFSDNDAADLSTGEDSEGTASVADFDSDAYDSAGFSLEDNVLDTDILDSTDNQFNLPDTFKDFADSHADLDALIGNSKKKSSAPEVDDQSLTDEEYARFLNRVNAFPLNMRLAMQDYIGNGNDSDENKLNLIRLVLSKASMKKIATRLEKLLDKSIPIPKHFQSSSVEEYERQKQTFKYWMLHKFLPVAVMVSLALLFAFCITVLSWQFIYKPLRSESLYKTGYAYLENGRYDTAIEKFDKACEYKRKKRWYFTYARGFKNRKLFSAAEKMYSRLIYDFKYDKYAGLEYADMLASDLRNYERAEAVIRRLILDYHVNDKDGLTALGDIYMTWGYENPEKYEDAVKIYSRVMELYDKSDALLARMLRYFIRTDNLAEVLPLKEYFVPRLSKITAEDITELGGYLLEKRYNPLPLDSEKLRAKIDDVRLLLEKAIQADKSIPEAYYHLGKFFIYNYKPHAAIENLTEAIKQFEAVGPMPPLRTVRYIDSMRLLGEQLTTQKKYLDAQNLYAQALALYKDYTALNPLPANATIGKLYADYGDIDYFISHDFDSALDSYQNAVKQANDTPSINYRIGYLYYQKEDYANAIEYISNAYEQKLYDKNLLYGLGNALFKRGNYFAAQAAYEQLVELLDVQRVHKGVLNIGKNPEDAEFIESYMHTVTNLGATLNQIAERNGDSQKNARALALYAEANRAWDTLTRNPETMVRSKSVSLSYLNTKNMINPSSVYKPEIYTDIPMTLENEKVLQQKEDK
ncbi:MAG: periplasmic flagellar collar protein FlcA, partial [Treponema sp.]